MAIKCGNCKKSHSTPLEVKACYAQTSLPMRSERPAAVSEQKGTITAPQKSYLESLMETAGLTEEDLKIVVDELDVKKASDLITNLIPLAAKAKREQLGPKTENILLGDAPPNGTYTVVFSDKKDDRATVRFYTPKQGRFANKRVVQYLFGPINTLDYRTFGLVSENGVSFFSKKESRSSEAVKFLMGWDKEQVAEAGHTYALESSRCFRCGKKLTVPVSIHRGLGPECARKSA